MNQYAISAHAPGKSVTVRQRSPGVNSGWTFQCEWGAEGLEALERPWQSLVDSDPQVNFYQCPAWARAYLEHLAPQTGALLFITGWREQNLRLVIPLERRGSELHLLHHDHMTLADALAPGLDDEVWPKLWTWMRSPAGLGNLSLRLPALPSHAVLERWLDRYPEPLALQRILDGSAWLSCDRSYADLLKGASANHRSNLVRGLKRASKLGPLRYESISRPDQLTAAMSHFLSIEASGWKGVQGGAVACKPELVAFYSSLCASLGSQGRCEIDLLWLGPSPIATIFWFRTGGALHLQKIAYLEELGELGPGRLIMAEALQRACTDPTLRRVSFITRCPWADGWRTEITPVRGWTIYPNTWNGRLLFALERAKISIKQSLRALLKKRLSHSFWFEPLWEYPCDWLQAGNMLSFPL